MRYIFIFILFLCALPAASNAQQADGEVVSEPICFVIKNEAPYTVYGSVSTNFYTRPDGRKARHRSNFRFEPAGSVDEEGYPNDIAEFCSYGPFYDGRRLEIVLRTLVPIFSCHSRIDQGPLVIKGEYKPEDQGGGTKTWIECYE